MPQSLTSDNDYLKLRFEGSTNITVTATSDADDHPNAVYSKAFTINHSLGEVPMVRSWLDVDKNGRWHDGKYNLATGSDFWLTSSSTTSATKIILNSNSSTTTNMPVYYKIYANGTKGFSSDDLYDKIFKKGTSSTTISASGSPGTFTTSTITIPHPEGEEPLYHIEFSEDGTNFYGLGSIIEGPPDTTSGPPGGPYSRYFITLGEAYSTTSSVVVTLYHNYGSDRTIYIRYALEYET